MQSSFPWIVIAVLGLSGCGKLAGLGDYGVEQASDATPNTPDSGLGGIDSDSSTQETDGDSSLRGMDGPSPESEADAAWGCLDGQGRGPVGPGPFKVTIRVQHIRTAAPIAGAEVALFRKIDAEEKTPLPESGLKTDAEGKTEFLIHPENIARDRFGIQAYARITKHDEPMSPDERIVDGYYYFNPQIGADLDVGVLTTNAGLRRALTLGLGSEQRDDRGLILVTASTCQSVGASGIVFELEPSDDIVRHFYEAGGIPHAEMEATGPSGYGGFVNVKPGSVTITARRLETGQIIDTVSMFVKPDAVTQSRLAPGNHANTQAPDR